MAGVEELFRAEIQPWGHSVVKAFRFLMMFLVVGLTVSASVKPTEANWVTSSHLYGENQGYCKNGWQYSDVSKCRENRTPGAVKPKKSQKQRPISSGVAGAQQLPSANISPVVLSEERTQVWRTFNLNPDCRAADVIVAKVTKAGKGQVEFEDNMGFQHLPKKFAKV